MTDQRCQYPNGNVPQDPDSVAARSVTISIDPEDAISILGALRETCCPSTLRIVAEAINHA